MVKFSKRLAIVLAVFLVFQSVLPGSFLRQNAKAYSDEAEVIAEKQASEIVSDIESEENYSEQVRETEQQDLAEGKEETEQDSLAEEKEETGQGDLAKETVEAEEKEETEQDGLTEETEEGFHEYEYGENLPPEIISEPVTFFEIDKREGELQLLDLSNWKAINLTNGLEANWVVDATGTEVLQTVNSVPSVFVSDIELTNDVMEGIWRVDTGSDDDFMGFVFGYQDEGHFYLFDWKQHDQSISNRMGLQGMCVKVVNTDETLSEYDFWNTAGVGEHIKTLYSNRISYKDYTDYGFILKFQPGLFQITIKEGETVIETIEIEDDTYTSGKFGFYNCSQEMIRYKGFQREELTRGEYVYNVEVLNYSGSPLKYSLVESPATMQIDKDTGKITWLLTEEDEGEHKVTVKVENEEGLYDTQSFTIKVVTDAVAPTVPGDLKVTKEDETSVTLNWKASYDNVKVSGYNIYRDGEIIDTVDASVLTYTDYVEPGVYKYSVTAFDPSGNESESSNEVIFDCEKPSRPENIVQTDATVSTITISWEPSYDLTGVKGYKVYRNDEMIGVAEKEYFTDIGLEPDTAYTYAVIAFDGYENESEISGELTAATKADTEPPTVPKNLRILLQTGTSIIFNWAESEDNYKTAGYEIYRNGEYIGISDVPNYTDNNVAAGNTYTYTVRAFDPSGNYSDYSSELVGIPMMPKITGTDPSNDETMGGLSNKLYLYFLDSGNMAGADASFEYSKDGTTWTKLGSEVYGPFRKDSTTLYFYSEWDLEALQSGDYMVRYTVYDADGNSDEMVVSYTVDRTPPGKVNNLSAISDKYSVLLTWDASAEGDVSHYNIYRSVNDEESFSLFKNVYDRATVSFIDRDILPKTTYYYYITAVDIFGQESVKSETAEITIPEDDIPPVILGISPINGTTFGKSAQITVRAEDNMAVSSITLQYFDDSKEAWMDIGTVDTSGTATFTWDNIPARGEVKVRAMARDSSGNISDGTPVRTYYIKSEGPEKVTGLNATPYTTNIILRWNDVSDNGFAYFLVEQKDSLDGEFKKVGTVSDRLGMNITGLRPGTTYYFRVAAYDVYGNMGEYSDQLEVTTTGDTEEPVVSSLSPSPGYYSNVIHLGGTAADNVGVAEFAFEISEDKENWTRIVSIPVNGAPKTAGVSYDFDITSYPDGAYYIRGVAYDTAGNTSKNNPFVEYRIDHTPPKAPEGIEIINTEGDITITWKQGEEEDIRYYKVYRSQDEGASYEIAADRLFSLGYVDRNVQMGKTYHYKISAVDMAGNESEKSDAVSPKLDNDTVPPEILSIAPGDGQNLGANPTVSVLASDNYKLAQVALEYYDGSRWVLIGSEDIDVYSKVVSFSWNTKILTNGKYTLRAVAKDLAGNESEYYMISYNLNVEPPEVPEVSAVPGDWKVELSWTLENEKDIAGFYVYRSNVSGGPYQRIKGTKDKNCTDEMLVPGRSYYYVVETVDIYGNISRSKEAWAVPNANDPYPPKADAGEDRVVTLGMEVLFDGRKSGDNDRIESYLWDFGDGTKGYGSTPSHTYLEEGIYEVTLTVYDPAGNSDTDTVNVKVCSPRETGVMEVRVIDSATGEPVSGASVYVNFPDGVGSRFTADDKGTVHIVGDVGKYSVAAYRDGYLPKEVSVYLHQYQTSPVTIAIEKGELVVGELNVRRLELDEIVSAGIDITAPENQYVYQFEVTLEFEKKPLPKIYITTNGYGNIIDIGGWAGDPIRIEDEDITVQPAVIPHNRPDVPPTIAYLVIPGEISWLKEFFEVSLTLTNMADPQFVIEDAAATLKLPVGLTLAPTQDKQSLSVDIGSIAGGETKEVKWIVRGDEKGSYDLEAQFNGTLMPFNDPVSAVFKTKNPLNVLAGDAMHLSVLAESAAYIGEEYYVFFQLTNTSDFPVYNLNFEVDGETYAYSPKLCVISEESIKANTIHEVKSGDIIEIPVLMPGESVWIDYSTIVDFSGDPSRYYYVLTNSYVEKRGVEIPTTVTAIPSHIYKYRLITNKGVYVVTERDNISITAEKVKRPGNTIFTVHNDVSAIETEDMGFLPIYYGVVTTADIEGGSIVKISSDITGYERHKDNLRLYHIKDGKYTDITENISYEQKDGKNIMTFEGRVEGFSYFAVGFSKDQKPMRLLEVTAVGNGWVRLNDEITTLPQNYKDSFEYGREIKLTAIPDECSEFAYWEDINTGRLVSTNPVYRTIITSGENLKAVFYKKMTEETNEFTVVFKDRGGRILKSTNVAKNQSAVPPKEPVMTGYQFVGWDRDFSSVTSNMVISPVFKRLPDKYLVTVEGGTLSTGETTGEYKFDMPVKVIANEPEEGMKFSHWIMDGRKVSIEPEFTFFMPKKDIVLAAVFVEDTEIVDTAPFITLSEDVIVNKDDNTMIFVANRSIAEGYTLIESGVILLKAGADYNGEITLETENILRGRIHNDSTDQFYVRKINVADGDIWYGRAYLIYEDMEGNIFTVYSENTAKGVME